MKNVEFDCEHYRGVGKRQTSTIATYGPEQALGRFSLSATHPCEVAYSTDL